MSRFYDAMAALNTVSGYAGVVNEVVTHTMSEFSRTINSNGNGTDHAWGQVAMVMGAPASSGGPLNGGQVYGRYPLQVLGRQYPRRASMTSGRVLQPRRVPADHRDRADVGLAGALDGREQHRVAERSSRTSTTSSMRTRTRR